MLTATETQGRVSLNWIAQQDAASLPEYWGAWFIPLEGGQMYKLNPILFYHLGASLSGARSIAPEDRLFKATLSFLDARRWLRSFIEEAANTPLPRSRETAQGLLQLLDSIDSGYEYTGEVERESKALLGDDNYYAIRKAYSEFSEAFTHECKEADVFFVSEKRIYKTRSLIENAEKSLPEDVLARLDDQTVYDIKQAGRCLAFDIPTAAGFHILKAVESLIREYHLRVTGAHIPKRSRNWGQYIMRLNNAGADRKVTGFLDHIREFYRNPIVHPEVTLTLEEALSLFGAAMSAIVQLDAAIQSLPAVASSPPTP